VRELHPGPNTLNATPERFKRLGADTCVKPRPMSPVVDLHRALREEHGVPPAHATHRAGIVYLALIGTFPWISQGVRPSQPGRWKASVDLLLS